MEANELRIGNWLEWKQGLNKIFSLSKLEGNVLINSEPIEECTPIPITEEWLERFGFERDRYYDEDENGDWIHLFDFKIDSLSNENKYSNSYIFWDIRDGVYLQIRGEDELDDSAGRHLKHIKYVHQLQNLYFAFTGEELGINE